MTFLGKYANYNYDAKDSNLIVPLESYLNENAPKIIDFFAYAPETKVTINIFPTKESYDNRLKKIRNSDLPIADWNIGSTTYESNAINLVSLNDYHNTSYKDQLNNYENAIKEYQKTILHEFVHYIVINYCMFLKLPIPCKCLLEGLAQHLSNQKENKKMEFKYTLDELLFSNNCYDGWLLFVRYILAENPKNYFIGLLEDYNYASREMIRLYDGARDYYHT